MILKDLKLLEEESITRGIPIIGSKKGAWLQSVVRKEKPKTVLELGTANGYSGIILGSDGAHLTTIEINPLAAKEAQQNFKKFNIDATIIIGDAIQEIKKLKEKYDLIFIDFVKSGYIKILDDAFRLANSTIIADNITFKNCQDFKAAIVIYPHLTTEIISIGDGLSYSKKF